MFPSVTVVSKLGLGLPCAQIYSALEGTEKGSWGAVYFSLMLMQNTTNVGQSLLLQLAWRSIILV